MDLPFGRNIVGASCSVGKDAVVTKTKLRIDMTIIKIVLLLPVAGYAQWLNYPTVSVPRLSNGQPNLTAPPPRTPAADPITRACGSPIRVLELKYRSN
jgi:hypothetical protein